MRAKLVVQSVEPVEFNGEKQQETVTFRGVSRSDRYPDDGSDENNTFAKWSPSVDLTMAITNPALWGKLKVGQEYYSDFTLAKDVNTGFKKYQSHKVVEAARILSVDGFDQNSYFNIRVEGEIVRLPESVGLRVQKAITDEAISTEPSTYFELGYLVRYSDGYVSYSPKKAFEEGYEETK